MRSAKCMNKGFTLVELSIVIVIIALIIAGISGGQSLVKSAQLRSILTQADQVRSVLNAFKLQYDGLPGDITNGYSYWATGCSASGGWNGASVINDCNGDGNKKLIIAAGNTGEAYIAWVELSKAGLFPGTFVPGAALTGTIGTNIPAARYPRAGITIGYDNSTTSVAMLSSTASLSKNLILFGAAIGTGSIANKGFLTATQASSLDQKADDNNAVKGAIYGGESASAARGIGTCASAAGAYTTSSTSTTSCTIAFTAIQ